MKRSIEGPGRGLSGSIALGWLTVLALALLAVLSASGRDQSQSDDDSDALIRSLVKRDVAAIRAFAWKRWSETLNPDSSGEPAWRAWSTAESIRSRPAVNVARASADRSLLTLKAPQELLKLDPASSTLMFAEGPKLVRLPKVEVRFNDLARDHIEKQSLLRDTTYSALHKRFDLNATPLQDRHIASFPPHSMAIKTVWFIVKPDETVDLPVWDPSPNGSSPPSDPGAWRQVRLASNPQEAARLRNAGEKDVYSLSDFYSITLQQEVKEDETKIAEPGDHAVLVAMHLASKDLEDWAWITVWWHDKPDEGPFAAGRPSSRSGGKDLPAPWNHYLLDATLDADIPNVRSESAAAPPTRMPNICFNPWLEGRINQGAVSNCVACHQKATRGKDLRFDPTITERLSVTRGRIPLDDPQTYEGRLRLDYMWSLATPPR